MICPDRRLELAIEMTRMTKLIPTPREWTSRASGLFDDKVDIPELMVTMVRSQEYHFSMLEEKHGFIYLSMSERGALDTAI
jgi:hypothetical protein